MTPPSFSTFHQPMFQHQQYHQQLHQMNLNPSMFGNGGGGGGGAGGGGGNFATASSQSTTTTQSADGTCTTVHETSGVNADGSRFTTRVVRRQTPDGRVFQEQSTSITN